MTFEELQREMELSHSNIEQLKQYASILLEQNKVMNLTAITEMDEVIDKHFYDSILISKHLIGYHTFCDVGSGAGFPGLVLAIVHPEIQFTLVEPTQKRCRFLELVVSKLGLENVKIVNERAEDFVKIHREAFEIVSARAVANLVVLSELCLPLVSIGGLFIAMKGQKGLEELEEAAWAIDLLGGKHVKSSTEMLSDNSLRYNIIVKKVGLTPKKYPRHYSQIKKNPLNKKKGG